MSEQGEVPAAYRKPDYTQIAQLDHSAPAARVLLTRDAILKATALKTEEVHVPEWPAPHVVLVRELRGRERNEFEASTAVMRGGKMVPDVANLSAKLVAYSVVGEDGERLFTPQDVNALGELSAAALYRVFEVASRLSGMSEADLEEMTGNSAAAPGGDSASISPASSDAPSRNSSTGSAQLS